MLLFYFIITFMPSKKEKKPFFLFLFFLIFFFFTMKSMYSTSENYFYNHFSNMSMDWISYSLIWISFWVVFFSGILYPYMYGKVFLFIPIFFFVFMSLNILFFFMFFEMTLYPIFLLIFFLGMYKDRYISLIYFFLYTSFSGMPLFISIFFFLSKSLNNYLFFLNQNFNMLSWVMLFLIFLSFMAKMPIFGLHFWLPKAHVDAPTSGSMILASILLKLSSYSLLRSFFLMNFFVSIIFFMITIGIMSFFFSSSICLRLIDYKVMVAYSSVSHMSLAFASLLSASFFVSFKSAFFLLLSHGIASPMMFFFSQIFYETHKTRSISNIKSMKMINFFIYYFFFFMFVNLSLPPFINFWSEFYIMWSMYKMSFLGVFFFFFSFITNSLFSVYLIGATTHSKIKKVIMTKYTFNYWLISIFNFIIILYMTLLVL